MQGGSRDQPDVHGRVRRSERQDSAAEKEKEDYRAKSISRATWFWRLKIVVFALRSVNGRLWKLPFPRKAESYAALSFKVSY